MNATARQIEFVTALRDRLHLSRSWFEGYCVATYGAQPEQLDIRTCSALIGELQDWIERPADLQRAMGQQDMFGEQP